MMLEALDGLADEADVTSVLDVGCGSGILALAAAHLGLEARGVDVDQHAVEEARENAERNGLSASFDTTPIAELELPADLVLANLHAEIMIPLAPDLVRLSRRLLVVCGILADREESVRGAFPTLTLAARETSGEWVCLGYRVQSAP
jgi:ribosomal protein L11 methyltransferase